MVEGVRHCGASPCDLPTAICAMMPGVTSVTSRLIGRGRDAASTIVIKPLPHSCPAPLPASRNFGISVCSLVAIAQAAYRQLWLQEARDKERRARLCPACGHVGTTCVGCCCRFTTTPVVTPIAPPAAASACSSGMFIFGSEFLRYFSRKRRHVLVANNHGFDALLNEVFVDKVRAQSRLEILVNLRRRGLGIHTTATCAMMSDHACGAVA